MKSIISKRLKENSIVFFLLLAALVNGQQLITSYQGKFYVYQEKDSTYTVEPKSQELSYCGTVQNFAVKIIETNNLYKIVKYNYGFSSYDAKQNKAY